MNAHNTYNFQRAKTDALDRRVDDCQNLQGKVLWLPSKKELQGHVVRRAHGKGAIEEGIFDHPVVVVSRPLAEDNVVHFHLITSLQGKRLDQLYGKSNEFHASRRTWYLPIAPTPDHPDALSKKTKKRFPTLELANGASLQWNSYVNIRRVYKVELAVLRPYTNPENPDANEFRFGRESVKRMLAKGKSLTLYEPGPQFVSLGLERSTSDPTGLRRDARSRKKDDVNRVSSLKPLEATAVTTMSVKVRDLARVDFLGAPTDADRIACPPPKHPPDGDAASVIGTLVQQMVMQPVGNLLGEVQSMTVVSQRRFMAMSRGSNVPKYPPTQIWRDMKGVAAVAIASI